MNIGAAAMKKDAGFILPEEARKMLHPELEKFIPEDFESTSQFGKSSIADLNDFMKNFQAIGNVA